MAITRLNPTAQVITRNVTGTINKAHGGVVGMTAPTISGYSFVCWVQGVTTGWVGSISPADPRANPSKFWNATTGQSGTGNITCTALYVRS